MEMTKERLAAYRSNRQEIMELDYILNNRWKSERMIGNDVIIDYTRGFPMPQSVVGFDQDRYEWLQKRDAKRKSYLERECNEIDLFISEITDSLTRRIFTIYFTEGNAPVRQSAVAKRVHLDQSRISRKIDDYLKTHNTHKKHMYNDNRASGRNASGSR